MTVVSVGFGSGAFLLRPPMLLAATAGPDAATGSADIDLTTTTTSSASPEPTPGDLDELVREHSEAVYRVALSITRDPPLAEDVTQDALLKAWEKLPTFRGEAPLRHWILRITHNTAVSTLRKRREDLRGPDDLPDDTARSRSVEREVEDRLAVERFVDALDQLDGVSRSIVVLRELESLSYEQICGLLDLPLPTVKTRLLRARRVLAAALGEWRP